jgi:hypothetical protein
MVVLLDGLKESSERCNITQGTPNSKAIANSALVDSPQYDIHILGEKVFEGTIKVFKDRVELQFLSKGHELIKASMIDKR